MTIDDFLRLRDPRSRRDFCRRCSPHGSGRHRKLGDSTPIAKLFAAQEQEHADALIKALDKLGGKPPAKPTKPEDVPGLAEAAGGDATDITNFAVELETMAVAAYYAAHGKHQKPSASERRREHHGQRSPASRRAPSGARQEPLPRRLRYRGVAARPAVRRAGP